MSTRRFLWRGMLRVYGYLCLGVRWYGRGGLAPVYVVWWGDVVARYLHGVGPRGRDDLGAVTLVVGWGNGGHRIGRGGNVRMGRGRSRKLRDVRWCRIRVYRRPSRRFLWGNWRSGGWWRWRRTGTKGWDGGGNVARARFRVGEGP